MPRILRWPIRGAKNPKLCGVRAGLVRDSGEVSEHQAGRLQWIVPGGFSHHEREVGLHQHGKFSRERQHSAVRRDQAIPGALVMMKSEKDPPSRRDQRVSNRCR